MLSARIATLSTEASAILRHQLVTELEALCRKDDLDVWTLRAWPKANTLRPEDGDRVRQAFQARLAPCRRYRMTGPPRESNWIHRRRRTTSHALVSTRACWRCRKRNDYGTGSICAL
jgi:hypothetical protein